MRHKQLNGNNQATAESYDKRDILSALYGQLTSIKKVMDVIALNEQRESISGNGKKLGFKLTKEEIKAMLYGKALFLLQINAGGAGKS